MLAFISSVLSVTLLIPASGLGPAAGAQGSRPSASVSASTTQQPADGGWPRAYITTSGARLVLYEPQFASWLDQKRMAMYAAVSYTPADQSSTALGTVRIKADTKISVPRQDRVIGLNRVLAAFDASQIKPHNVDGVQSTPPPIFFSTRPAVLNIDGDPIWSRNFFLRVDKTWMTASNVEGPWKVLQTALPVSFSRLPDDDNWKGVKAALGAQPTGVAAAAPTVFVSTTPAELMLLNGGAAYTPVKGTHLEWVSNTDSDGFRLGTTGTVYYLVSGRWFSSPGFNGRWVFATPDPSADFKQIPLEHQRSRVLASVPGTTQALEAARCITRAIRVMAPDTTSGPAHIRALALSMVPTAERDTRLGTTPVPELTRVALRRGDQAAPGEPLRRGILELEPTRRPARAGMFMAVGV